MLKKNDEKINGFLFVIGFPLLLLGMSYDGFTSSYTQSKTVEKFPPSPLNSACANRLIPNCSGVSMVVLMHYLMNGPSSLVLLTLLNIFILSYEN